MPLKDTTPVFKVLAASLLLPGPGCASETFVRSGLVDTSRSSETWTRRLDHFVS